MPPEISEIVWLVAATVFAPGICLLLLSRFGFAHRLAGMRAMRTTASNLGFLLIALGSAFFLFIQTTLGSGGGSGGLGSMGNPLGAILLLAYVFVVAPLAILAFLAVIVAYVVKRRRDKTDGVA